MKSELDTIDVAEIMSKISLDVELRYSETALKEREKQEYGKDRHNLTLEGLDELARINGEICCNIKTRNHLLAEQIDNIHRFDDIPWYTPNFEGRNPFSRAILKFVSKVISKAIRFATVRQKELNDVGIASLKMLQESVLGVADWSRDIEIRLKNLSEAVKQQDYYIAQLEKTVNVSIPEELYLKFEDKYRGSKETIQKRQRYYLEKIIEPDYNPEMIGMVLDLGCGRGEWLSLLKEKGFECIGVDANAESLKCCELQGIKTVNMDMIDYLKTLPCESVKILTSFQVVEHISMNDLLELFVQIGRVMRKDGVVVIETLNPTNLQVGAASFYLDPTHRRPLHQEFLKFLAENNGLLNAEIDCWQQDEINAWWDSVWKEDTTCIEDSVKYRAMEEALKKVLWIPSDYALVAKK